MDTKRNFNYTPEKAVATYYSYLIGKGHCYHLLYYLVYHTCQVVSIVYLVTDTSIAAL